MMLLLFLRTSFRSGGDDDEDGPAVAAAALRTFRRASHTALRSAPLEEDRRWRRSGCVKVGDASGGGDDCAARPPTKLAKSLARTLMVRTVLLVDGLELKGWCWRWRSWATSIGRTTRSVCFHLAPTKRGWTPPPP
jgi:hypothetical protein